MAHTDEMIEHTLTVSTREEAEAVEIAEMIARFMVALSGQTSASITTSVDRYEIHCHHEHDADEHEVQP